MFLSQIEFDRAAARDPYQWHRALWKLFPGRDEAARDFLFRVEEGAARGPTRVLLQSAVRPESAERVRVLACREYALALSPGRGLRFRLLANPVRTIKDADGRLNHRGEIKSCRVPLIREEEQLAWLARKLEGGARLLASACSGLPPLYFRKKDHPGKLATCLFDGVLEVTDAERFGELIRCGVGPGKAFGCGMLSLARG